MPNRKPQRRRNTGANRLASTAVIGFSLTLVGAGVAMLLGLVPNRMLPALNGMDASVLLLFVPLCALTLAILAEAARTSFGNGFRRVARPSNPLEPWRPGRGEG
jgi:hypothetical protein